MNVDASVFASDNFLYRNGSKRPPGQFTQWKSMRLEGSVSVLKAEAVEVLEALHGTKEIP